jgi:hypothetical protein
MGKAAASASAPVSFLRIEHLLSSGRGFEVGIAPWFPYLDHMAVQVSLTTSRLTELKSRIEFTFCYGLSLRSSVAFHTTSRPCSYVELRGEVIPGWILTIWLCTLSGTLMRPSRAHPTAAAKEPRLVPPDKLRPRGTQHSAFSTASTRAHPTAAPQRDAARCIFNTLFQGTSDKLRPGGTQQGVGPARFATKRPRVAS